MSKEEIRAIERDILLKIQGEILKYSDEMTCSDYEEGYKDGTDNALTIINEAILHIDLAQDDKKPIPGYIIPPQML